MPEIKKAVREHWEEKRAERAKDLEEACKQAPKLGDAGDLFVKIMERHIAEIDAALVKLQQ